jgi:hypothetical protein
VAGIRVRANLPTGRGANPNMGAALLPVPVESVWTWRSRGAIHGAPGTEPVGAPAPVPGADRSPVALASTGIIGLPSSTPGLERWYPALYYQTDWPEHFPGQYLNSSHEMPVPATQEAGFIVNRGMNAPGGINQFSPGAFFARLGGAGQITQPASVGRGV